MKQWLTHQPAQGQMVNTQQTATPLYVAAQNNHSDIVKFLVAEGHTDVNAAMAMGGTALITAAHVGHLDIVKFLALEAQADVNRATIDTGSTPLFIAAQQGHIDIVRCLALEAQADVNQVTKDGRTPIDVAAQQGRLEVVRFLALEAQANVDQATTGNDGCTPIQPAWYREDDHKETRKKMVHFIFVPLSCPPSPSSPALSPSSRS